MNSDDMLKLAELLPCPFCGCEDIDLWRGFGTQADISCKSCGCERSVQVAALADRIELAKVALITEGRDDDGEYETTDHLEIDERHLIAAALRAYAAPSETGHEQSEVRSLTAVEQAGVEKAIFASGTVTDWEESE